MVTIDMEEMSEYIRENLAAHGVELTKEVMDLIFLYEDLFFDSKGIISTEEK